VFLSLQSEVLLQLGIFVLQ